MRGCAWPRLTATVSRTTGADRRCTSTRTDDGFYVADGEMMFVFEDREVVATTGRCVLVPRDIVHTARNTGGRSMRGLLILSPGDAEHILQPVEEP